MPRSTKDSDDDVESKPATGRMQTRMLTVQSVVNSPLRRSSRIKQNKYSPGSESDSSISSSQTTRSTRTQTATMDSTVSDTTKKLRTRKHSISSEISDIDVDIQRTPGKRITRQSLGTANLVSTSPRVNTRAASKRFMRAGSETQSPLPASRTTRKTRASSIDPESLFDQNKSQSGSPIKTRMRASISGSHIKEQIELEDRIPYVRLDSTIVETDEITSSGNSDSSPDKALRFSQKINRKHLSINKDEVEEDYSHAKVETLIDSSKSDEPLQEKKDEMQTENMDEVTVKNIDNIVDKGSYRFGKTPSDNATIEELSIYFSSSPNRRNSLKEDEIKIVKGNLDIEVPFINICESTKELEILPENLSDTSIEEQKSNKENQILNIISDVSVEKSTWPKVTSVKSLTLPLMNKSLSEKETKSMNKELNLSKRRHSRESTEIAIKHSNLSKETVDSLQEKMDISIESLNSPATNDTILLHDNVELVDKVTNKHETSIENTSTSSYNEDATKVIGESDKINKECTVTDSKNSNKIDLNEVNKTCSSMSLAKSTQINDSKESLISILTADDNNEIKLILEERSPRRDENEISSNVAHSKSDQSIDLQISLQINESSNDSATLMDKQSALTQDKVVDNSSSIEQEQNLSKHVTELVSESFNTVLETNNSIRDDSNNAVIQENQFSDLVETFKKSIINISPEKTDAKNILSEKIVKQNLKRKSIDVSDNLEEEKESSQMETSQKDQENMEIADDVSDVNAGIDLFQDIPADKWEEKNDTSSVPSTSQLMGEVENENEAEAECDLILVDKRAWLAAETIKAAKEAESFEYDSDDTVLLKSRLDASQANCDTEKLATIDEELLMDIDSEGNKKRVKKRKSRTKRRLVSEIDQDSSRYTEDEDNFTDKSLNESTTALNQTNDRSISILNKSEQSAKTRRRSFKASNEEEIEDDTNELNRSSLISKNNISLRKSMGGRTSLNKSSKDTSIQNMSVNKSRIDNSEEEFDDTDAHTGKKLYKKKRSLNKSCNESADDNANESEESKKNVLIEDSNKKKNISLNRSMDQKSKPIATGMMIHLNDDESNNSDISITAMDLESKTYSLIANMGSTNSDQDSDQDECNIPSYLFAKANSNSDTDDNSSNSDINREYNLDGVDPKFSDDSVAADECRTSEVEFSDSDDNGSDLADFIVNDDEIEDEEEEDNDEDDDEDNDEDNDKEEDDENMQNIKDDGAAQKEKMEDEEKQAHIDTELINVENENENKDVKEKDALDNKENANKNKFGELEAISSCATTSHKLPKIHKSKNKSIEYISPHKSETETKQSIKIKANMKKSEEPILLNSSNLDLSIKNKNKSLIKENETIVSDTSNLISSPLKMKTLLTKTKLDSQYSSRDGAERNSSEQLNEFKSTSTKKLSKSCVLMECSTPNLNSCKKLELETFEKTPNKDIKSNNTIKATQNTSIKKNKSKKDLTLNEDINLEKFSDANKEKMSDSNFSPDLLELLEKTSLLKSTSKTELRRTMNINIETPTLKYLRKEKLNESAPILKSSTETTSLQKKLSGKNTTQIKLKEKNKEIFDLSSDDAIQKLHQKNEKKRKRQKSSNENITDQTSQDGIKLNVSKKKKVKLTQSTIVEDNIRKDVCQTSKRRKKNKKQNTSKENIIDEVLSEDAIKLNIPKKKKHAKSIQLTTVKDNTRKDTCQISEKKKKKKEQDTSKENITDKVLSEDAIELNVPKKKHAKPTQLLIVESNIHKDVCQLNEKNKKKKIILSSDDAIQKLSQKKQKKHKKQEISNKSITDKISQDGIQLNVPKKKKTKLTQLTIEEDNIREDTCQISEKQDTSKKNTIDEALFEDVIELNIPKKKKHVKSIQLTVKDNIRKGACQISEKKKKQDTSKENTIDKALFEDVIELNIPKKKKHVKSIQLTVKDNIRKGACQISEKKKKQDTSKENTIDKALFEDVIELNIPKKKKHVKSTQLTVKDNIRKDAYQISKKKKKQDASKENIVDKALSEDVIELNILKKKKHAKLTQLPTIENNTREDVCQINKKRKTKKQGTLKESITNKTLLEDAVDLKIFKKKKRANLDQLTTIQDNTREDACQMNEKKKKQINVENTNINEDNMLRKNIRGNKTESAQYKKTNKIINNLELDSLTDKQEKQRKKKIKQQNSVENIESLWIEKKNTLPVQIPVSKLKSEKNALPHKLQKTTLCMNESKNVNHCTKTVEVDKVHSARMCIPKELQLKKKRNRTENVENTMHVNVPTKKSKKIEEMSKFLSSSSGLKRLSDDVIENLADMPTRAKKRRKISRNEEKIISSVTGKSKTTADRDGSLALSTSGSTTKFHIVNLQDTKKQSSKGAAAVASFRQRMLARNNRESISAYMMYREKMSHAK